MLKTTRNRSKNSFLDSGPDLTAMLDIIFMLLVFFILTSGTAFRSLDLKLPSSSQPQLQIDKEAITMVLGVATDHYFLDDSKFSDISELSSTLAEKMANSADVHLVVATDKGVPIQRFLDVLSELSQKNIDVASILTKATKAQPSQ